MVLQRIVKNAKGKNFHTDKPENCPRCRLSTRTTCTKCGHALTGYIDTHGRTTCEACGEKVWLGVGNYND
jgi:membrane protease subunit (stomatin/prohibitin family)